jgi:hypothetical protein
MQILRGIGGTVDVLAQPYRAFRHRGAQLAS